MNCQQFQDVLQDLARYDGLDAAVLREALEHADGCAACDQLLEEAEALSGDLRSLAAIDGARQASPRIERAAMAAFARSQARTHRVLNLRLAAVAALAGVAALAFFAVVLLRHVRPESGPQAPPPSFAAPTRPNATSVQSASAAEPDAANASNDALAAYDAEHGSAGSFVPLTQSFDPASLDGEAVVRVALSRSDLAGLGLSASGGAASAGPMVLADMIVTSDGTPQAIRLVDGR